MEDTLITFETAKLAKKKGFKEGSRKGYLPNGEIGISHYASLCHNDKEDYPTKYAAPTQSLLAKWLREENNIHLIAYKNINIDGYDWCYITTDGITNINSYKTYEEALEDGLQAALKLIDND